VYLFEAMELMRSQGHEVALFSMADERGKPTPYDRHFVPNIVFKNQRTWIRKVRLAAHAVYSPEARRRMRAMIADFRPDVAHVRNIYHHLSPSILWELKAHRVPVVYHLNDFKLLCPSYNLVWQGETCEACKGGKFWHVVGTNCYPGAGARMTLAAEAYFHKWLGTYRNCVDCFLAPSRFVRDKFVEHGWDSAKFEVLPHFQRVRPVAPAGESAALLYFGRLSAEKGVGDLLRAMQRLPRLRLMIAGEGPERENLQLMTRELELRNVDFLGYMRGAELERVIASARFTVLPSHAYETLGKTILESYAEARAVVASDWGSRRELVRAGETGLLYRMGDVGQLASAIEYLAARPSLAEQMGRAGQEFARQRFTPEAHYEALVGLYERLVAEKKAARAPRRTMAGPMPAATANFGGRDVASDVSAKVQGSVWSGTAAAVTLLPRVASHGASTGGDTIPLALPTPKLRIAFIGGRGVIAKYSGVETYYEQVGKRLVEMGHEVTAYCRTYFTPAEARHNGMRLVRLPTIRSKHLETAVHTLLSTIHVFTQSCDIVHYHTLGPALFSCIPRLFGKKTVVTVQGLDWQRKKWGRVASLVLRVGERAAVGLPSGTMVVSQVLQQYYREHYGAETRYVPNGGVLRRRQAPHRIFGWGLEAGNYLLFLGRFSPEKGCHLLVEAYEQLDTDAKLVMAGASSYCTEYSRSLRAHAGGRINMLDPVSGETLDELLTNAMVFVLPSDLEGLSLALLDAMGAGLCVLASDVPENRELVEGAGFTFRRGDAADLAGRLRFLIANPAVREAAGEAAKRRIRERYLWPDIAVQIERAYLAVMGWDGGEAAIKKPSGRAGASAQSQIRAG